MRSSSCPRERQDVGCALAQRRQLDREHREPVVEVLAEARPSSTSRARSRLVAAIQRTSTSRVRLPPTRSKRALLQHAQELGLQLGLELADLVEEEGAAVGELDAAAPARGGAGEGALLVAEQLALEQRLAERRAVDRDERARRARAPVVDGARRDLLAGAALAEQQHGRVGARDLLECLDRRRPSPGAP